MESRTVGVIGGMGPAATVEFLRRIVNATAATRDQDHLHMIIDSNPQVPDRNEFILRHGADPRPTLIGMARRLEAAGAELLVMPCNTAHYFANELAAAVKVRFINWPREVADALGNRGITKVGTLATDGTLAANIYGREFDRRGIVEVVPSTSAQSGLMELIYSIKNGTYVNGANDVTGSAVDDLAIQEAQVVLLACTELSLACAGRNEIHRIPVLDAMDIVVDRVIALARAETPVPHTS